MLEKLRIFRNLFLRAFVVSAGFLLLMTLVLFPPAFDWWLGLATAMMKTDATTMTNILIEFIGVFKLIAIIGFLVPGLALHWTYQEELKKS